VSRSSLLLRMELQSDPELLCVVRNALGQLAAMLGFSEVECHAVVLAVDEAMTNIIRHAYRGNKEQPIQASFYRVQISHEGAPAEALEIVLEDSGVKVNPGELCGRALEDVRPGGLGLHFIRESMDTVEFDHKNGKNQLRLVKMLKAHKPLKGS
jgi:serine/threonine-protein kinase RsbW